MTQHPPHLIVTHHSPDLDAIGSVWLLKRFDAQHYADAKIAFVNPGETLSLPAAQQLGFALTEITHVDTGLGEFDHHQPDRGQQYLSATLLVYNHVCQIHPELAHDTALRLLVDFITEIDHFSEIKWPQADHPRYTMMIHELINGANHLEMHNDDSQLHFGLQCLDIAYSNLELHVSAQEIVSKEGHPFTTTFGPGIGFLTPNDEVIKLAQKQGFVLVVKKDPHEGGIRIKARPDSDINLKALAERVKEKDSVGSWYYHPSGKMLINGSRKHTSQSASPLTLDEVIALISDIYG